jgi:hypothetical protein
MRTTTSASPLPTTSRKPQPRAPLAGRPRRGSLPMDHACRSSAPRRGPSHQRLFRLSAQIVRLQNLQPGQQLKIDIRWANGENQILAGEYPARSQCSLSFLRPESLRVAVMGPGSPLMAAVPPA